jgi:hypothetical protein
MKPSFPPKLVSRAQTVFEYLLVLGVTTAIALWGFRTIIPQARVEANIYYDKAAVKIFGPTPKAPNSRECGASCYP